MLVYRNKSYELFDKTIVEIESRFSKDDDSWASYYKLQESLLKIDYINEEEVR